jgi:hypothetical protein
MVPVASHTLAAEERWETHARWHLFFGDALVRSLRLANGEFADLDWKKQLVDGKSAERGR